jgi:hypothetical protein
VRTGLKGQIKMEHLAAIANWSRSLNVNEKTLTVPTNKGKPMSLKIASLSIVSSCIIGLFACSDGQTSSSSLKLTGGIPVGPVTGGPFPSTVNMDTTCTGAKIGPRHFLFAAHCAFDFAHKSVVPSYINDASFVLTNSPYPEDSDTAPNPWIALTVEHTYFTNSFWNACTSAPCDFSYMITQGADLAIVKVKEDTPSIPVVPIDYRRPTENQWAVLNGYGCEEGRSGRPVIDESLPWGRLKYQVTAVGADSILSNIGGAVAPAEANWNFFTPGRALDPNSASLCPGDSGGPIYGWLNNGYAVIGVNSAQTSWDSSEVSVVNIHSRLDTERNWIQYVLAH